MTCDRCGGPLDPDVIHVAHWWDRWDCLDGGCDCPEVCAGCCRAPGCALREPQEPIVLRMRSRWNPHLYWSLWRVRRRCRPEPLTIDPQIVSDLREALRGPQETTDG